MVANWVYIRRMKMLPTATKPWAVDDIENCLIKLVAEGAIVLHDTSNAGGGIKVATVIDPWSDAAGLIKGA